LVAVCGVLHPEKMRKRMMIKNAEVFMFNPPCGIRCGIKSKGSGFFITFGALLQRDK
jgi:hypothetical protein